MKHLFVLFAILFQNGYAQTNSRGLLVPDQKHIDSLPWVNYIPKRASSIPNAANLKQYMPEPGDQGNQGSCSAWAVAYGLKSYHEGRKTGTGPVLFSPAYVFNPFRKNDGNCQNGILLTDGLEYIKDYGCSPWDDMEYDPDDCSRLANSYLHSIASRYKIEDWTTIYAHYKIPIDKEGLANVKSKIAEGTPVAIAIWPDKALCAYMDDRRPGKSKWVSREWYDDTEKSSNYHAMVCVGYNDISNEITLLNSYGPDSGYEGYIYLSDEVFLKSVYEAYYIKDPSNRKHYATDIRPMRASDSANTINKTFYGWVKKGYYITIDNTFRLSCVYLKKSANKAVFRLLDISQEEEKMIGSYECGEEDFYEINYNGRLFELRLDKIAPAGLNIFKNAAFIEFSSRETK